MTETSPLDSSDVISIHYPDDNYTGLNTILNVTSTTITRIVQNSNFVCGKNDTTNETKVLFEFITNGILLNIISLFGLFGNAISMIILSRPQMKSSINYLLIGLARCDTVLIIMSILVFGLPAIYAYTGLLFDYVYGVYPKILRYLYPFSCMAQMVTVYLTLTVTLERYIAVCHPLRARSFCTYGRARLAVYCIVVFSVLYNLPKFWEVGLTTGIHGEYNVKVYCYFPTQLRLDTLYISIYVNWMYLFVMNVFPISSLIVFNVAIYRRVRKANRDLQHLSRHQRREIGLATMLLCVVMVFIICNILPLVSNIYETFVHPQPPYWLVDSGNLLVTINSSVNFIIYVIFGRKFKRIFLRLFCSSKFFGPGRDSPEFQTNDESIVTNTTNIELRNSLRQSHLHRSNTTIINRNNNIQLPNGINNGNNRQSMKSLGARPASPGPCVYYPARSPSQISRTSSHHNGWNKRDIVDTVI